MGRGRGLVACGVAVALMSTVSGARGSAVPARASTVTTPPNIVLILTDDQRWNSLWAMPNVQSDLAAKGVTFSNSFVVDSLCCPSRASILTGKYSHGTSVYANAGDYGGFHRFSDVSTVATWLHGAGYHTGLVGKYLNGYKFNYIPPGWDRWFAVQQGVIDNESAYYYNYSVLDQSTPVTYGNSPAEYSTDVFAAQADSFIRGADQAQPLFLYFAPAAPHFPAKPADRYQSAFPDLTPVRPPNYNEAQVFDKPAYIRRQKLLGPVDLATVDAFEVNQYRTLLAVDDAVHTIVTALADTGRLANTMIVFASDNGLTLAEHRWKTGKLVPYEESIRVPLVIRYDPLTASPSVDDHMVANIDLAPTFAEAAGVSAPGAEGLSLVPLLSGQPPPTWRSDFLIEHMQYKDPVPSYCAVRTAQSLFVTYNTGETEFYDLNADPFELVNKAADPAYASDVAALSTRDHELCTPVPPGFVWP